MVTISIMICALALIFFAEVLLVWYLHKKIGYYKRLKAQHEEWENEASWASLQVSLRAIRRFAAKFYPEGQPRLDMAAYSLSQYMKHMRWLASKQEEGKEDVSRSVEQAKINGQRAKALEPNDVS